MAAPVAVQSGLGHARVAFTGRMASMTRREAAERVRAAGAVAVTTVSRRTSLLVVGMDGWPLLPDGSVSRKLRRAEELGVRIESEAAFLERLGLRERTPRLRKSYPASHVCGLLGIDQAALDRWEQFGLIRSQDGLYDFQDLVSLRTIAELVLAGGVDPAIVGRSVRGLAAVLPGTDRPLSQLKIILEHPGTLLAELGDRLVAPDGQLVMGFGPPPDRGGDGPPAAAMPASAEQWLDRGRELEEREELPAAVEAYREAVALAAGLPEAHFNLGNALRDLGRPEAAEERFRMAVELDPGMAAAWYNLADLMDEANRHEQAAAFLERAVAAAPDYADAHFNLACCYEQLGRRREAVDHWRAYLRLDPEGDWARIAREHLS